MKKLLGTVLLLCLVMSIAGCTSQPQIETRSPEDDEHISTSIYMEQPTNPPDITEPFHPIEPDTDAMYAISLPPVKETVIADDGTELMTLSFRKVEVLLPDETVAELILGDLQTRMGSVLSGAADVESAAWENYQETDNWSAYFIDVTYTPTRLDRSVMSLFGNHTAYSGGPHPSMTTDSVTYDLESGNPLFLDEILTRECNNGVLSDLLVETLSAQSESLYSDYEATVRNRFSTSLHNIKDWYFSRSGLCFHFPPYDIAPYSSGTIIAEIPYEKLQGLLIEAYQPDPMMEATGSMYAEVYLDSDEERFTTFADVVLAEEGTPILLYCDDTVTNVRVEAGTRYTDTNQYIAGSTIFAANAMDIGDAIRLTLDLKDEETLIKLIYHCGDKEYSAFVTYDAMGDSIILTHG